MITIAVDITANTFAASKHMCLNFRIGPSNAANWRYRTATIESRREFDAVVSDRPHRMKKRRMSRRVG
jgi:hypothetical protein